MNGCLKGVFRLVVVALLLVVGAVAWWYREPLLRRAAHAVAPHGTALPRVTDTAVGAPTPRALESTQRKVDRLQQASASDSVVLTANEVASLVGSSIDWSVRKSFDSLRVELLEGSIAVYCRLDTRVIPADVLGPIAGILNPMEPLRIAGPISIERPGIARWSIKELSLRGIAFPPALATQVARRVAGADSSGAVPLRVSPAFQDVTIHPGVAILYRTRHYHVAN